MKNKRLIIFLSIFVFLAVIVVLSSTVFTLHSVSVKLVTDPDAEVTNAEQIIESGKFRYGESIFFTSKKTYTKNIEKANPYLMVVNIETIAPSKLVVHVANRQECFVIKLSNNKYAVTDEKLKVLNILDVYQNNSNNAIEVKNSGLAEQDVEAGDFFESDGFLTEIFTSFREWNLNYTELKEKISSIQLDYEKEGTLLVNMRSGVKIVVENSKVQLSDKLNLAFSFYDTKTDRNGNPVDYTTTGTILITETETEIYGLYKPE